MYFPFLTCEVKCGAAALDIADRQNSHSMTHAVRAVVQLYKYAKWEEGFDWKKEVHREILAFSISHDDKAVRIYGYYPVLEDDRTTFYRHPIRDFSLTDLDGRDKWTAYKFTKNVYEIWMPKHLKRITKAIDALPVGLNFNVSSASFTSVTSAENESDSQEIAASAPVSQDTERMKKPKLTATALLREQLAQRDQQLMLLLKQQNPSTESKLQRDYDRQQQEIERQKHQIDKLMDLLKQRTPSNASSDNESMLKEQVAQQKQGYERQLAERDERLAQEKEESKQRHTELIEQLRESQQRLVQENEESQQRHTDLMKLMGLLKQRKSLSE